MRIVGASRSWANRAWLLGRRSIIYRTTFMTMEVRKFLGAIATQLVSELTPILDVKGVTTNPVLLGSYTEAAVRNLVHRIVQPMRICTGAVLDLPMPVSLRQIDIIIWAPYPAPAIFEVEGFGLVPKSSAFGVLEVKRSNYRDAVKQLEGFLADVEAKRIVAEPAGPMEDYRRNAGLGVISVLESAPSSKLQALMDKEKVVAIFETFGDQPRVREKDVLVLVNFLHYITWRYRVHSSRPGYPQIDTTTL
jgi:hypothetical protein